MNPRYLNRLIAHRTPGVGNAGSRPAPPGFVAIGGNTRRPRIWRSTALAFAVLGGLALAASEVSRPDAWSCLGIICGVGLLIALPGVLVGLRDGARRALTDHALVLVAAFSLYFLVGPLVLVIGPQEQASYSLSWFPADAQAAVLVTSMNLIGLAVLLLVFSSFSFNSVTKAVIPVSVMLERVSTRVAFWSFILVGGAASYVEMMFDRTSEGDILSGLIRTLARLLLVGILIGVMYRGRGRPVVFIMTALAAIAHSVAGLLLFNKSLALFPWLIVLFGIYLRRASWGRMTLTVTFLVVAASTLTRPILDARSIVGPAGERSLAQRLEILRAAFALGKDQSAHDAGVGLWPRLSYTVPQVAAMNLYDAGQGGDDAELAGWVFLPRALFPQKPVITRSGTDFYYKIAGHEGSSVSPGLFVDGYYNMGWLGLLIYSAAAGLLLAVFSAASRSVVATGSILLLPVPLLGGLTAFRVDGHFMSDFWGSFVMVMVPLMLLAAVLRLGSARGRRLDAILKTDDAVK